jgi:leader peptidase (prepilin peptidase)/N-methyltransferase
MGLGDAKLMAMLGAWLGLRGAMESFFVAVMLASFAAFAWLTVLLLRRKTEGWANMPLPFGTFLCLAACGEVFSPNWISNGMHLGLLQ